MGILETLGLKDKNREDQETKPVPQDQNRKAPHAHGGCCGSCGGQKQGKEQK